MGMYDKMIMNRRCPVCKKYFSFEIQTKDFDQPCLRTFQIGHDHKKSCKDTYLHKYNQNDTIPLKELKSGVLKRGWIDGVTSCLTPECEWYGMRAQIVEMEKHWRRTFRPYYSGSGRGFDVRVFFDKKTGMLTRAKCVRNKHLSESRLRRYDAILTRWYGERWTKMKNRVGEPFLALRKLSDIHFDNTRDGLMKHCK